MPTWQGCSFSPNTFLSKSFLRKLEEGLMLINLPDALILQNKKPIKNITEKFYMDFLAYPGIPKLNPKSLSPVQQTDFICCVLSVTQSTPPFLKCLCAPLSQQFLHLQLILIDITKKFRRCHGKKKTTSKLTTYQAIEC